MVVVKCIGSEREEYLKDPNGETGLITKSTCDARCYVSKEEGILEFVNGVMDSNVTEFIDVKNVLEEVESAQKVNGEKCSLDVNSELSIKKKRRKKEKKLVVELGDDPLTEGLPVQSNVFGGQQMDMDTARFLFENLTMGDEGITIRTHFTKSRKRLLVLDVNGLLSDIVHPAPKDFKSDTKILKRAIFKRPFLDDFLEFCFERFDVAIWSSRTRKILDPVVDYLFRDLKKKLLFIWDLSHCTNTSARSFENRHKFVVFKYFRKIWEEYGPILDSDNGYYDESNTLLLDDSPYKALLNPKHSGIFPSSYCYQDINDKSLGPNGDLRVYLEGLAATNDVKTYVEQHPFGQRAIDETSPHWSFYSSILKDVS
ncbi:uncharacterized protein [Rutidosis leptorrhynchoides]|uniref:uncharacterized protein n=1 Tax=Rutidosis leptorrhynchoides TaxID=125765 RepID=UPI003A99325F